MKKTIAYKEISDWSLSVDFLNIWKELLYFLENNNKEFHIWIIYNNNKLKLIKHNKHNYIIIPQFIIDGYLCNIDELDLNVKNIKYKRKYKKDLITLVPRIKITHYIEEKKFYDWYHPIIKDTNEIILPTNETYMDFEKYVYLFENFFKKINLKDKKKLINIVNKWNSKKDKYSLISFWKTINKVFNIEISDYLNITKLISNEKNSFNLKSKIYIDTIEHYNMVNKTKKEIN